jgi:hypothetical protein
VSAAQHTLDETLSAEPLALISSRSAHQGFIRTVGHTVAIYR